MTTLDARSDNALCDLDKAANARSDERASEGGLPNGMTPLDCQVAGHLFDQRKNSVGMLRGPSGRVLKPAEKPALGAREIAFYESLQATADPVLLELRNFVPRYYGTTELQMFGRNVKFLILKDITEGMSEPCVMDIKIGRRTWDPTATAHKRAAEEAKYAESKRAYGFCITGFQVYRQPSGDPEKYGKDYGKHLDAKGVREALAIFLNATPERPACRQLIVKLLSSLWKILAFFRAQKALRFYSSSLLVAYDARRLRHCLRLDDPGRRARAARTLRDSRLFSSSTSLSTILSTGPSTSPSTNLPTNAPTALSTSPAGSPRSAATTVPLKPSRIRAIERSAALKRSVSLGSTGEPLGREKGFDRSGSGGLDHELDRLCRTHSFVNNYDRDIARMKEDYDALLDELSASSEERQNWVRVNMIDFTHVFPAGDRDGFDLNYLEGIENLIKLVEAHLPRKDAAVAVQGRSAR